MVPRRIKLRGFMSFREEAELLLDGPALWVLTGENGSGKSAIFDAIAFALYGVHRTNGIELEGTKNLKALINHQAPDLEVEFEFSLGSETYMVKRTLSKRGRSSFQAYKWQPGSENGGRSARKVKPGFEPESGTHLKGGFDKWRDEHIGLDAKAFSATVLLGQGKTDALLCHKPEVRHKILSQIIDISAYARLHQKAKKRYDDSRAEAEAHEQLLQGVPAVNEEEVTQLEAQLVGLGEAVKTAQEEVETIISLKAKAERWNSLLTERAEIELELRKADALIKRKDKIEEEAQTLEDLRIMVPRLESYLEAKRRLLTCQAKAAEHEAAAEQLRENIDRLNERLALIQAERDELKQRQEELQQRKSAALATLTELSPQIHELDELERLRAQVEQLDQSLAQYPPDLDGIVANLQARVSQLDELKGALSDLDRYVEARHEWRQASDKHSAAQREVSQIRDQIRSATEEHRKHEDSARSYAAAHEEVQRKLAEAGARLEHVVERLGRFSKVDGQQTCSYCGQTLNPEHLDAERNRIEEERRTATLTLRAAETEAEETGRRAEESADEVKTSAEHLRQLQDAERGGDERLREGARDMERAERLGRAALERLPGEYLTHIAGDIRAIDVQVCFGTEYPSADELSALREQAAQRGKIARELTKKTSEVTERDKIRARREPIAERLDALESSYPADNTSAIRQAHDKARRELETSESLSEEVSKSLSRAERSLKSARNEAEAAQAEWQGETDRAREELARSHELRRNLDEREAELIASGCEDAKSATDEQLEVCREQMRKLAGAEEERRRLREAERQVELRRERLSQIERDSDAIPLEARVGLDEVEERERASRAKRQTVEGEWREAGRRKQVLETQRERHRELEQKYYEASRREALYKELTKLLGPEYLQRYLLQQAERGIVEAANEVLDRVSGNALQLKLDEGDESAAAATSRGASKALDLVAINTATSDEPIPVENLSGSQRFRVAVSLALGIGRHAGQGASRMESVIIDEGFGSLDKRGRREMIDELHLLRDELKRIILVSHQEEIADAFTNKYLVELRDRSSCVSLVQ